MRSRRSPAGVSRLLFTLSLSALSLSACADKQESEGVDMSPLFPPSAPGAPGPDAGAPADNPSPDGRSFGEPCDAPEQCASRVCFSAEEGGEGVCTELCDDVGARCEGGFRCEDLGIGFVCTPDDEPPMPDRPVCGDGVQQGAEACDSGEQEPSLLCPYGEESCEVCTADCELIAGEPQYCGDGVMNGPEACDGGDQCDEQCRTIERPCAASATGCPDLDLIPIAGGTFIMGSNTQYPFFSRMAGHIAPAHHVTVPDFQVMRAKVTVAQYRMCVEAAFCQPPQSHSSLDEVYYNDLDEHPMTGISWHEANIFATWVGARLLTEAEWAFAASSRGQDHLYPWGNGAPSCETSPLHFELNGDFDCNHRFPPDNHPVTGRSNIAHRSHPVCMNPAGHTEQGLCDMIGGNGLEWLQDEFHDGYEGAPVDGSGWCEGPCPKNSADPNYDPNSGAERAVRGILWGVSIINEHPLERYHTYHWRGGTGGESFAWSVRLAMDP